MKKNVTISILVAVVAIIAIIFVFVTNKKPSEVALVEVPTETTEAVVGWQTYRNEELGFEVQYPEGWFVKDYRKNNPQNSPLIGFDPWESNPGGSMWNIFLYNRTGRAVEEQLENLIMQQVRNYTESDIERSDVIFNTYPAVKIVTKSDLKTIGTSFYIAYEQYIYRISVEDYSNVDPEIMSWPYNERYILLKQLGNEYPETFLNSFRFID